MKVVARILAALVLLIAASIVLPRPAGRFVAPDVAAQIPPLPIPTPTVPPIPDPIPDDPDDPVPDPVPEEGDSDKSDEADDGDEASQDGGASGSESSGSDSSLGHESPDGATDPLAGVHLDQFRIPVRQFHRIPGAYNTDVLTAVAARLRALGWSREDVLTKVFAPFILGGRANWVDTWGAPRYGPGALVRTHEGQDVFCEYGDPVLSVDRGTVSYGDGGLGGIVARVHSDDGGYWYYAHLSETNSGEHPSGSTVEAGDIIGFCGNTGNAITTPPHVHFGWYQGSGTAANPMRNLIGWLEAAEEAAVVLVPRAHGERIAEIDAHIARRHFGDAFAPSPVELDTIFIGQDPDDEESIALAALEGALSGAAPQASTGVVPLYSDRDATDPKPGVGATVAGFVQEAGD